MNAFVACEQDAESQIAELRKRLKASEKVKAVLIARLEQRDAMSSTASSILEQNLLLERTVANKIRELETERLELRKALNDLKVAQGMLLQAQKMESIGQLAAGMAHEINTPIQYVTDNVRFVRRCYDPVVAVLDSAVSLTGRWREGQLVEENIAEFEAAMKKMKFDYIKRNVPAALEQSLEGLHRVASIVAAMKDFSHPSTGAKEPVQLGEVIKVAATVARNEWKYVADLDFDIDPELPLVPCLRDEIGQVVLNLIVNAAHAISDVVQASAEGCKGHITVSARVVGEFAEIRIADTGTGIPVEARNRIFDPFFTTKPVGRGTGQGLMICYSTVVDKHKGKIFFETEMGRGTTFVVQLPLDVHEGVEAPCE